MLWIMGRDVDSKNIFDFDNNNEINRCRAGIIIEGKTNNTAFGLKLYFIKQSYRCSSNNIALRILNGLRVIRKYFDDL